MLHCMLWSCLAFDDASYMQRVSFHFFKHILKQAGRTWLQPPLQDLMESVVVAASLVVQPRVAQLQERDSVDSAAGAWLV